MVWRLATLRETQSWVLADTRDSQRVVTVVATVSVSTQDGPTAARANSYDERWQSEWVAHAASLLGSAANQKTNSFVFEVSRKR